MLAPAEDPASSCLPRVVAFGNPPFCRTSKSCRSRTSRRRAVPWRLGEAGEGRRFFRAAAIGRQSTMGLGQDHVRRGEIPGIVAMWRSAPHARDEETDAFSFVLESAWLAQGRGGRRQSGVSLLSEADVPGGCVALADLTRSREESWASGSRWHKGLLSPKGGARLRNPSAGPCRAAFASPPKEFRPAKSADIQKGTGRM